MKRSTSRPTSWGLRRGGHECGVQWHLRSMALGSQREQRSGEGGPGVAASARQQAAELAPLRRARDGQAADGAREPHLHLAACRGVLLRPQAAAQLLPLKQASHSRRRSIP